MNDQFHPDLPSDDAHRDPGPPSVPDPALGLLGEALAEQPPSGLRPVALVVARERPRRRPAPLGPVEALAGVVADVGELLRELTPPEWETPDALAGLSVRDTVSHMTGADRYLGIKAGAWSAELDDELDHLGTSRPSIDEGRSMTSAELLDRWHATSDALIGHLRTLGPDDLAAPSRYNVIEAPLGGVLVVRAFELWTHAEDVCRATGRPLRPPAAGVLGAMTDVAADLVPIGFQLATGATNHRTLRLVLTGLGGGTWDRCLTPGVPAADPDVVLIADAVGFCRLIARRLDPEALDHEWIGEPAMGEAVLAGAMRFAMD